MEKEENNSNYEVLFIVKPTLTDEKISETVEKVKELISKHGEILDVDDWGKRRLAYMIDKNSEGYYVLIHFNSEKSFITELTRRFRINENIMRHLVVHYDPSKKAAVSGTPEQAKDLKENEETTEQKDSPEKNQQSSDESSVVSPITDTDESKATQKDDGVIEDKGESKED